MDLSTLYNSSFNDTNNKQYEKSEKNSVQSETSRDTGDYVYRSVFMPASITPLSYEAEAE